MPAHSDLIRQWCERLCDAFGKNPKDGLIAIWQQRLAEFDRDVLERAFTFIETTDERFPTVSRCLRICCEQTPYNSPYDFRNPQKFRATQDKNGVNCVIDVERQELLYRAVDCEEGRGFLAALKKAKEAVTMNRVESFREGAA